MRIDLNPVIVDGDITQYVNEDKKVEVTVYTGHVIVKTQKGEYVVPESRIDGIYLGETPRVKLAVTIATSAGAVIQYE